MTRTPIEVVQAYNNELWNKQRLELADELIADTLVRHEIGSAITLTRAEARQRVVDTWAMLDDLRFDIVQTTAEGERVAMLYECTATAAESEPVLVSSIEVFRVVDGRICEVWNSSKEQGAWH